MRELQAQAAEKRMRENETRGIKNIDNVKRQQAKKEQTENLQTNQSGGLKVYFLFKLLVLKFSGIWNLKA